MKRFNVQRIIRGIPYETDNKYLVVNVDEPYAEKVFEMIRDFEKQNGTWDDVENFTDYVDRI